MVKTVTSGRPGPTDTFHVAFDTLEMPGAIVATTVRLTKEIGRDGDTFRVDLAAHPLYPDLEKYVLANPSRRRRTG